MSKKQRTKYDLLGNEGSPDFDWTPYETGWTGGSKLVANKNITAEKKEIIFSHASYAGPLYEALSHGVSYSTPKDNVKGTVYDIKDVKVVSKHEILIDTTSGMSAIIDMNKERQFLDTVAGGVSVAKFIYQIQNDPQSLATLLDSHLAAKVMNNGRVSLWDGHLAKIEADMMEQIHNPASKSAYDAVVESINLGGFIVDIMGVKCFMPGSLSAAGVLTDFNSLIGRTIPVMVVNYVPSSGFVVSYKKYLNMVLPSKIENELYIGKQISAKVTGKINNGLFVQFKDDNKEWVFSGLIHRSVMSPDFEKRFDRKEFVVGDEMVAYINNILETKEGYRIVVSDVIPETEPESEEETSESDGGNN